ncbi:MAG: DNA polymerase III subunit delta [Bacteroidales bacterium]|nr:DNA polymerase III subunit delta [Bacteroidales bacterium]
MVEFKALQTEIKNGVRRPVYLLMGEEPYYIDAITALLEADASYEKTVYFGKDVTAVDVVHEASQYSMFAPKRMIIVKEAQEMDKGRSKDFENIDSYLKNMQDDTILVLCYKYKSVDKRSKIVKDIDKLGAVMETKKLYDNQLPAWIASYVADQGISIEEKAVSMLAESIGLNLSAIVSAIDKLKSSVAQGELKQITAKMVSDNIGVSNEYNIFEFQDAIMARDVPKCNRIVKAFVGNPKDHPIQAIIASLFSAFQKMFMYYYLPDKSTQAAANQLGINSFVFQKKYEPALRRYNATKCMQVISLLSEYDAKSKGMGSASTSTEDLLPEMVFRILN